MDKAPQIAPTDPTLDAERAAAQADKLKAIQLQTQGDTASIMARYGTRLALAGTAGTSPPLMAAIASKAA